MAAAAILKFYFNSQNSVAIAHIRTIFDAEAENEVLDVVLPSNVQVTKSKMAATAKVVCQKAYMSDVKSGHHVVIIDTLRYHYLDQSNKVHLSG